MSRSPNRQWKSEKSSLCRSSSGGFGALSGGAIGGGIGWIADELRDFDEKGEAITQGCTMTFSGRWITDSSHQHNEIHDIVSAQLIECNDCQNDKTGS